MVIVGTETHSTITTTTTTTTTTTIIPKAMQNKFVLRGGLN
jgi:hypothetical protein